MNALFLTFTNFGKNTGVGKKISKQIDAIKKNGFNHVFYSHLDDKNHIVIDDLDLGPLKSISKILSRLRHFNLLINFIKYNEIKFVYFRFNGLSDPSLALLFRKIRKLGVKVVMEFPTYPYDGESIRHDRFYYMDKITRSWLAKQVSYIITFSDQKKIFGKDTITISNGVDFESIKIIDAKKHSDFNIIGVANLCYWHGFDRIIHGLNIYNQTPHKEKVYFHIVSGTDNEYVKDLKIIVGNLGLNEYVIFHGEVVGGKLDELFNKSDLAIGSLGRHRNRIFSLKTLKNVEYAARGIPFIYSENNSDFDDKEYVLKEKADDSPINITKLIEFRESCRIAPEKIRNSISNLSWDTQMKKILTIVENDY